MVHNYILHMLDQLNDNKAKLLRGFVVNPNISSRHVCNVTLSGSKQNLMPYHEKSNHYQNQVTTLWSIGGGNHIL